MKIPFICNNFWTCFCKNEQGSLAKFWWPPRKIASLMMRAEWYFSDITGSVYAAFAPWKTVHTWHQLEAAAVLIRAPSEPVLLVLVYLYANKPDIMFWFCSCSRETLILSSSFFNPIGLTISIPITLQKTSVYNTGNKISNLSNTNYYFILFYYIPFVLICCFSFSGLDWQYFILHACLRDWLFLWQLHSLNICNPAQSTSLNHWAVPGLIYNSTNRSPFKEDFYKLLNISGFYTPHWLSAAGIHQERTVMSSNEKKEKKKTRKHQAPSQYLKWNIFLQKATHGILKGQVRIRGSEFISFSWLSLLGYVTLQRYTWSEVLLSYWFLKSYKDTTVQE